MTVVDAGSFMKDFVSWDDLADRRMGLDDEDDRDVIAVDVNNDGWLDIFGCDDVHISDIWGNDGTGSFTDNDGWIDLATAVPSDNSGNYGSVFTDYDCDGDLDLYIAKCRQGVNDPNDPRRINVMYQNDGNNNFTEVADAIGLVPLEHLTQQPLCDHVLQNGCLIERIRSRLRSQQQAGMSKRSAF